MQPGVNNAVGFSGRICARTAMLHKRFETMKSNLAEIKQRLKNKTKWEVSHMAWVLLLFGGM